MKKLKKPVLIIMALSIIIGATSAAALGVAAAADTTQNAVSVFDDGYQLNANWIWADAEVQERQWASLRKTFTLDEVPEEAFARISADTKYWLWINGEMAIFEGQLKLGDSSSTWYYDKEDISKYLVEGENTIAVSVYYSGILSGGTIKTEVPAFLFEANIGDTLVCSDTTWRAVIDPACSKADIRESEVLGESNTRYDASKEMIDANGKKWTDKDYDDSAWAFAVNQDEKIRTNVITKGTASNIATVYDQAPDPRKQLVLRSIPQWYVDDIHKYTADGANGTGVYTVTEGEAPLMSLPGEYVLEAEVEIPKGVNYWTIGLCVCFQDEKNFYMPQINLKSGLVFKPHTMINGNWSRPIPTYDLSNTELGKSIYDAANGVDKRSETKYKVRIEVKAGTIDTYLNDVLLGTITDATLAREGSTVGLRQTRLEPINIYSLKVTDISGNEIYNANIDSYNAGDTVKEFNSLLAAESNYDSVTFSDEVFEDAAGDKYVTVRNSIGGVSDPNYLKTYTIVNETNQQGTPYVKVKSVKGGETINIASDSWVNGRCSIRHQYVTRIGEQEYEALMWMNGYVFTFEMPASVEVLELGFRPSGYNTTATGSVTTDNEALNQLYQEAFDTLYVCMRDTFLDCPDRERVQWWGDAVSNMQQAAYTMDEDAALLYKKTLKQVIGFVKKNGALPSKVAIGRIDLELPAQSLAGVHSFWQYYMYYGDEATLLEAYPYLMNYLKLWGISENGIITDRSEYGLWDWVDWEYNIDAVIIKNCWYYLALDSVLKIANLEGSGATEEDIEFLTSRMRVMKIHFDALYWDESKNAYYYSTENGLPDDRANAMAVYAGLADITRYDGILSVLTSTFNACPYMEKYILEAMYLMDAADEAIERTVNRYAIMLEDGYPTLTEQFAPAYNATKNHAWSGGPLSLLYMYNAGITATSPAFKTIQIRPQLGSLNNISAVVERASGKILVSVEKGTDSYLMSVTIPEGATSGVIYVPRLEGIDTMVKLGDAVIYANGSAVSANMPAGVSYAGEDEGYIGFNVASGEYSFTSEKNVAAESDTYEVTLNVLGNGAITVNGVAVDTASKVVTVAKGAEITVVATPDDDYRLVAVNGSYAETVISETSVERSYVINSDTNLSFVFEEITNKNKKITITATEQSIADYALNVYMNGTLVSLPYTCVYPEDGIVTISANAVGQENYTVTINGENKNTVEFTVTDDTDIVIGIAENSTVDKKEISSANVNISSTNTELWSVNNLIDGIRISDGVSNGYTSGWGSTNDVSSKPYVLTFDLGSVELINQIAMFPRSNAHASDSALSCNYPVDFSISVSEDGVDYTTVVVVKNESNPKFKQQCYSFKETQARYVRLTVTKLGLPASDEGADNHYRLQLAEFEVYYNSFVTDSNCLGTPYGLISDNYADVEKYPFVVFDENGNCIGAHENLLDTVTPFDNAGAVVIAKNYLSNNNYWDGEGYGDSPCTAYIVMRADYTMVDTETYNNVAQIQGLLTIDLNGFTLTSAQSNTLFPATSKGWSGSKDADAFHATQFKFTNGSIVAYDKPVVTYNCIAAELKTFDIAFEDIEFKALGTAQSFIIDYADSGTTSYPNISFTNCTFDITESKATDSVILFNLGKSLMQANFTVEGGSVIAGDTDFTLFLKPSDVNGTLTFSKGDDEKYLVINTNSDTAPEGTFNGGELEFVKVAEDSYTLVSVGLNSFTPKSSITLGSELVYNVYVPVSNLLKSFTVDGATVENAEAVTLDDGNSYYRIEVSLPAKEAARNIILRATVTVDGKDYTGSWTMSIPKYAAALLETSASEEEKTLVKDVLQYIRAAYAYFGTEDAEQIAKIDTLLGDYASKPTVEGSDAADTTGMKSATLVLSGKPSIRFYLADGANASAYKFYIGGKQIKTVVSEDGTYIDTDVYAYELCETVTYTINGEAAGSFHINAYYAFVSGTGENSYAGADKAELTALTECFWKYLQSARAYRESVVEN